MVDIENREDIELLVKSFYQKLLKDELMAPIFIEVARIKLEEHLPILYNFWATVLFGDQSYTGNPMEKHIFLHKKHPLLSSHFDQWLFLWKESIQERFKGPRATEAYDRAVSIAAVMKFKIEDH